MHRRLALLILCIALVLTTVPAFSRPYYGDIFTFFQPDGTEFQIRLYGDEFYAVAETLDGYTLTQDSKTGFYCYALTSTDGMSFISTGIRAGESLPPNLALKKNARLSSQAIRAQSETARRNFGVDSKGQLLPSLRMRLRPEDYGHERWTPALEAEAMALGTASAPVPLAPPLSTTTGTRVGLVLLAQFPDRPGDVTISHSEIDAYANDPDYTGFGNATSVYGYFSMQSDGKLQYNNIVTAYFTAAHDRAYYTDPLISYGTRARELITEGLEVLRLQNFDFTKVDGEGNGVVDGVNIFYAGDRVNNWSQGLWPHKSQSAWLLFGGGLSPTFQYQITNIGSSLALGTFCHENGHMICNFPDLYSYNPSAAAYLGNYSLMHTSGTTHPVNIDAYLKIHAGWATTIDISSSDHLRGSVQVDRNTFYRYRNPARGQEYFLLSLRTDSGYEGVHGGSATAVNPTSGLVIWHALETGSNTYSSILKGANPSADYSTPYELMVVEANPFSALIPWYDEPTPDTNDAYHAGDKSEASDYTTPALKFWNGSGRTTDSGMHVHSVSGQGDTMTFIAGTGALAGPPVIGLTSSSLDPVADFGTDAASQSFAIFNSRGGTLNYTLSDNVSWLSVSPSSGTSTTEADQITVAYATNGLAAGTYNGTITITDGAATNSPQTIPVSLTVYPQPTISLSSTTLSKSLATGATGTDSFIVSNSGGGTLSYMLSEPVSWLSLGTSSGTVATEEDEIEVIYDASRLFDGTYNATITVSSGNATNSSQIIDVDLNVSGSVGHVMVFSPDGGENLWQSNQYDIRWLTDGSVSGNVKIELYKGGALNTVIAASTPNDGEYNWSIGPGQTPGADYRIRVTSVNEPAFSDGSLSDFSVVALPALAAIPYSESFEAGFGIWTQSVADDFDWTRRSGSTSSADTGPASAQDGSFYLYTESSTPNYPDKTAMLDGYFDLRSATAPILSFFYHMYGDIMGDLLIQASPDQENWTTLFSRSWNQGNSWHPANADLAPFAGQAVLIRITGTTSSNWTSDMAFDALSIAESVKTLSYSADILTESGSNDGSIPSTVTITLAGDTFSADAVSGGYVAAGNVPPGLSALFVRDSSTQVTFSLSGNAASHGSKDSVSDLVIQFGDGAFTGGDASAVTLSSKSMIIDFDEAPSLPEIDVQGNGTSIADGAPSPLPANHTDFDSIGIGGVVDRTFTIVNTGSGSLELSGSPKVAISGSGSTDFTVTADPAASVAPGGGSTIFTVRFDPSAIGPRPATISIVNNDPDENPYTFSIQGTGVAAANPEIDVRGNGTSIVDGDTTPSLADHTDFDVVRVNGYTAERTFIIVNTGTTILNLTDTPKVAVGGPHAANFTVTADPVSPVASGGGTTTFTIRFDPSEKGLRSATITIANDDADENPYTFSVQGTGLAFPWNLFFPAMMKGLP